MPTIRLVITGKVQGVFYRVSAKKAAKVIGVTGWVRNRADGSVEAVAHGTVAQLSAFEEWCKEGPRDAVVNAVTVTPVDDGLFQTFDIR